MNRRLPTDTLFIRPFLLMVAVVARLVAGAQAAVPLGDPAAINAALAKASPGDTVLIRDGLYRDAHITLTASGQAGKLITLAAETPGRVTFTGRSRITLAGKYQYVTGLVFQKNIAGTAVDFENDRARHCRLSHCAFNESGDPQSTFAHLINVGENCTDNQIDHCYVGRSLSMSIGTRYGAAHCRFDHNWFHDIVARGSNGQEAIQLQGYRLAAAKPHSPIKEGDHRLFCTVEYNLFDGACGDDEIVSVKSTNNTIRCNTFLKHPTRNQGGLNLRGADNNVVDSNCFFGTASGIRISGSGQRVTNNYMEGVTHGILLTAGGVQYTVASNNLVANNTVVARQNALSIGVYYGLTRKDAPGKVNNIMPTGNKFYNNVFTSDASGVIDIKGDGKLTDNDFRANLIACSNSKNPKRGDLPKAPGLIAADATLLVKQGDRFVPGDTKLAMGQGVAVEGLREDFAGRARKDKPDIGCEELNGAAAVRKPLTTKDVGPDWMKGDSTVLEKSAALDELRDLIRKYPDPEFRQQLKGIIEGADAK